MLVFENVWVVSLFFFFPSAADVVDIAVFPFVHTAVRQRWRLLSVHMLHSKISCSLITCLSKARFLSRCSLCKICNVAWEKILERDTYFCHWTSSITHHFSFFFHEYSHKHSHHTHKKTLSDLLPCLWLAWISAFSRRCLRRPAEAALMSCSMTTVSAPPRKCFC